MGDVGEKLHIKNCYAEPWKVQYSDIRLSSKQTESVGMACSYRYIAAPWDVGGGGMMGLINIADCGRNPPVTKIKGHTASIQDLAFSPFYESILASGSEDMTIRIWDVPSEPHSGYELKDPVAILSGSAKKIIATEWNPVADFILASGCFDGTVALWDVDSASMHSHVTANDAILSVKWSFSGDRLASTSKDKLLSIIDPRANHIVASTTCHEGAKAAKCCWVDGYAGISGYVLTTGFSKSNEREIHLWDTKNLSTPAHRVEIDRGSQPLYPIFDETTGLIYVGGKGDGNMRYFQLYAGELRRVDDYRSSVPIKSFCFMPKLVVDQMRAEVGRMFKNENGKSILPISFVVPRKNQDVFQADLYPPVPDVDAALTATEWLSGKPGEVRRINIQPGDSVKFQKFRQQQPQSIRKLESKGISAQSPSVLQKNVEKAHEESRKLEEIISAQEAKLRHLEGRINELEPLEAKSKQQEARIKELEQVVDISQTATNEESLVQDANMQSMKAEVISLRAQMEDGSKRIVALLQDVKSRDSELAGCRSKLSAAEKQLGELMKANQELSSSMAKAHGTLNRAATLSGLDDGVRSEFNELRDFFREILDGTLTEFSTE